MIYGKIPNINIIFNTAISTQNKILNDIKIKIEQDLCNFGTTEKHQNLAIFNSLFVYLLLIYDDVNSNVITSKDSNYFKCKYNWNVMVNKFKKLGFDLIKLEKQLNLFIKQDIKECEISCL